MFAHQRRYHRRVQLDYPRPIRTAEFFAGIGLVREALEPLGVSVVWANDIERAKLDAYAANHGASRFQLADVREITREDLPADIELATSSFPCIDLSLAGNRAGLEGAQSGMFWEFARVLDEMRDNRPNAVLLENARGFATSNDGEDLGQALRELSEMGYTCDVFAVDAKHFVPQSRPRMFIVGIRGPLPERAQHGVPELSSTRPNWIRRIYSAHSDLNMHFLELPELPIGPTDLSTAVQKISRRDLRWWTASQVVTFLDSMSATQAKRLAALRDASTISYRTAYRRTRSGVAVWELRRDAIAGCLRTTGGGSSRQALAVLGKGEVRVRWMTPLEYAALMGASGYKLRAGTENQALFGLGDAVVVDVVRWIGQHYLVPALRPAHLLPSA